MPVTIARPRLGLGTAPSRTFSRFALSREMTFRVIFTKVLFTGTCRRFGKSAGFRPTRTKKTRHGTPVSNHSVARAGNNVKKRVTKRSVPYDTEKEEDLVAPKAVLLPFNAFLVVSQWIAFCVLMWWYSSPANNAPVTSIQTTRDAWSNRFNFDTCMELARQPKISSPAADDDTVIWWTSTAGHADLRPEGTATPSVPRGGVWITKRGGRLRRRFEDKEYMRH